MTHVCKGHREICAVSGNLPIILESSLCACLQSPEKRDKLTPDLQARTFIETFSFKPVFWNDL